MAQSGSRFATFSKVRCASSSQNECNRATPRLNISLTWRLQVVSKDTDPSIGMPELLMVSISCRAVGSAMDGFERPANDKKARVANGKTGFRFMHVTQRQP